MTQMFAKNLTGFSSSLILPIFQCQPINRFSCACCWIKTTSNHKMGNFRCNSYRSSFCDGIFSHFNSILIITEID